MAPLAFSPSRASRPERPANEKPAALANLDNLQSLEFVFPGRDQVQLTGWSIYAEPVNPKNPLGPVRQVGDDDEGFSCVDDVARIALVYLRDFEKTGNPQHARKAKEALKFCLNLEDGNGLFYNFVEKDGAVNSDGHTSFLGLTWWTARAFRALAEGERVLQQSDPELARRMSASLDRTTERLQAYRNDPKVYEGLLPEYGRRGITPGTLPSDSASITALFALGLAQRVKSGHGGPGAAKLLEEYAQSIAKGRVQADHPFLGNLHLNSLNDTQTVHLYGNRQVEALCEAAQVLGKPELLSTAKEEGDHALPRLLAAWTMPFAVSPSPEPFPQIAYSAECAVSNLQALYKATGEEKYSELAGLAGTWFMGANVAGKPVYDAATGRSFDGVDPQGVSINSGAESNVESLLALQTLEGSPGAELCRPAQTALEQPALVFQGSDFVPGSGAEREHRGLNGGAVREIWKLAPGATLSAPEVHDVGLLTWTGDSGARLSVDQREALAYKAPHGFQTDRLASGSHVLQNTGTSDLWVESLVDRPSTLTRRWSGEVNASLTVTGLDTLTTADDNFIIHRH